MSDKKQITINTETVQKKQGGLTFRESFSQSISASINKISRVPQTERNTKRKEFPKIFQTETSPTTTSSNFFSSTVRNIACHFDKETLYDENINLKKYVHSLKKTISSLKLSIQKLEAELKKKDKFVEEIHFEIQSKSNPNGEELLLSKTKSIYLMMNLKKQVKDLETDNRNKNSLIEELKKNQKSTKINELQIELKTYLDEINRLKSLYKSTIKKNTLIEGNLKEFEIIQGIANNQNIQLNSLEEARKTLERDLIKKEDELIKYKSLLKEKDDKILKLIRENKMLKGVLRKERNEEIKKVESSDISIQNKLMNSEKKLSCYKKDLLYYKDLYE